MLKHWASIIKVVDFNFEKFFYIRLYQLSTSVCTPLLPRCPILRWLPVKMTHLLAGGSFIKCLTSLFATKMSHLKVATC